MADAVAAVSPGFVVVAHDPADTVFGPEHAEALFGWARQPKALRWMPGGGHGRSMLTPDLVERLRLEISTQLRPSSA